MSNDNAEMAMPFLGWQVDRICEAHGDVVAYERFRNAVHNELERILGIP
jgi:hypothetical protein